MIMAENERQNYHHFNENSLILDAMALCAFVREVDRCIAEMFPLFPLPM
jgi:hypothetical protein